MWSVFAILQLDFLKNQPLSSIDKWKLCLDLLYKYGNFCIKLTTTEVRGARKILLSNLRLIDFYRHWPFISASATMQLTANSSLSLLICDVPETCHIIVVEADQKCLNGSRCRAELKPKNFLIWKSKVTFGFNYSYWLFVLIHYDFK